MTAQSLETTVSSSCWEAMCGTAKDSQEMGPGDTNVWMEQILIASTHNLNP